MIRCMSVLITPMFLLACGGDSGNNSREKLVGTWMLVDYSDVIFLNADGSANYTFLNGGIPDSQIRGTGTWHAEGNQVTIDVVTGYFELRSKYREADDLIFNFKFLGGSSNMSITIEGSRYNDDYILMRYD